MLTKGLNILFMRMCIMELEEPLRDNVQDKRENKKRVRRKKDE